MKETLTLCALVAATTNVAAGTRSADNQNEQDSLENVMIENITVTAPRGISRKTPIAMSNVSAEEIETKMGNKELPELFNQTPGIYATKYSGAFGDSKLNMRGFQSSNIAVMVNGVPVNDMEWGGIYWSNWAGLGDMVSFMQTQRGLGASKIAAPSLGGTINIATRANEKKRHISLLYGMGNDGTNQIQLSLASGLTKGGWSASLLLGKKWGDGYVQGTDYDDYDYFFTLSKRLGDSHQLSLTAFGSPQSHYQRSSYDGLTVEQWQLAKKYMNGKSAYRYNPTYGFGKNGERKTSAYNQYHKPQFSLNHIWRINDKSYLSSAVYMSIGRGYGNSGQGTTSTYANAWYGSTNGVLNSTFRNSDGTYAYDQVQELNENSTAGSMMVMAKNYNNHLWYGLMSTYTRQLTNALSLYAGIDLRSYKGTHKAEISDLYNGQYYTDLRYRSSVNSANNAKALDPNWKYEKLTIGDVVFRDYDSHINQQGVFAQLEYSKDNKYSAFVSGTLSNSTYWRYDRFYYDEAHAESDAANFISGSIKGGFNYNFNAHNNAFFNIGYISRAPYFSGGVFLMAQSSNVINNDAVNEKAFSFELGYGFHHRIWKIDFNAYYTKWMDKTTMRSGYMNDNTDYYSMQMTGVNAIHKGLELDVAVKPVYWLEMKGAFSLGDWRWANNATAYFYNSANEPLANLSTGAVASAVGADDHLKFTLNQDNIHVGGSAQTTAAFTANFAVMPQMSIGATLNYYGRLYADYAMPSYGGSGEITLNEPWKVPDAAQLDLNARYDFKVGTCMASIIGNVYNVFDYEYIQDAFYDGTNSGWQNAYRIFYSYGRTFSVKLKLTF